jgi:hypothetical protein
MSVYKMSGNNSAKVEYVIQDLQECIDSVSFELPNYFATATSDLLGGITQQDPLISTFIATSDGNQQHGVNNSLIQQQQVHNDG